METSTPTGRVVRVFDDTTLVVNLGTETVPSVATGDRLIVYSLGDELQDPETGESLGRLEWVKARVKVVSAQACMSITQACERMIPAKLLRRGSFTSVVLATQMGDSWDRTPRYAVDAADTEPHEDVEMIVRKGDLVRVDEAAKGS